MHCAHSGVADHLAQDDAMPWRLPAPWLSNLGPTIGRVGVAQSSAAHDEPLYPIEELYGLVGISLKRPYDARELIARLVDGSELDEFKALFGTTLVTGLLDPGMQVGILANNGVLHSDSARRAPTSSSSAINARFPCCSCRTSPALWWAARRNKRASPSTAPSWSPPWPRSRVPKITLIVGGSFGAGNYGMCGRAYEPDFFSSAGPTAASR